VEFSPGSYCATLAVGIIWNRIRSFRILGIMSSLLFDLVPHVALFITPLVLHI
jgi:hypothetical protein